MRYIKHFEKLPKDNYVYDPPPGYPEDGDYVLMDGSDFITVLKDFIDNNIGQISRYEDAKYNDYKYILVKYKNIPIELINYFTGTYGDSGFKYSDINNILFISKSKEELELKLAANKYNL